MEPMASQAVSVVAKTPRKRNREILEAFMALKEKHERSQLPPERRRILADTEATSKRLSTDVRRSRS
jgi:hypothetical protein